MLKKKIMTIAMATVLMAGTIAPASAAGVGNNENVDVKITTEATTVNMTIPSSAEFIFKADGSNTVPTNFTIQNNSAISGVHLNKADFKGQNSWKLADDSVNFQTQAVNTKLIKFKVGANAEKLVTPSTDTTNTNGTATFTEGEFNIPASGSKVMKFAVERGAFDSTGVVNESAFNMTLDFAFNTK